MENREPTRSQRFVADILEQCARDKGFAARLRRADNPDTEPYASGILCAFGVDLERDAERRPFALIGAALYLAAPALIAMMGAEGDFAPVGDPVGVVGSSAHRADGLPVDAGSH